ncbi:MAG TPA: Asp-tRNA(Asn)/Glu-tRNA(Gln) amidotransferase subunit GatC [Microbacteriaceae bacterium]|nr:Asp-tRNA(Asn)/Glu-tRNA(Gln) amidotransferase subunit GatC [Microbacteriaceae bacterium]
MPEISVEEVAHLAELARIDMTPEEIAGLTADLAQIVDAVARVNEVATDDVPATSHPMPLVNVLRDDVPRPSLDVAAALSGAPEREGDRFRVAPILEEE